MLVEAVAEKMQCTTLFVIAAALNPNWLCAGLDDDSFPTACLEQRLV